MRKKVPKLIISFKSATAAMAMEAAAVPDLGRLIPLPAEISAGCGLAFCCNPQDEREITELIEKNGIDFAGKFTIEIYEISK